MNFTILYNEKVISEDLPILPKDLKLKIENAIDKKLKNNPEIFGKPLRKSLRGYRRLRVSDYRVIYRIENNFVKVIAVQHRSKIYKNILKRMGFI